MKWRDRILAVLLGAVLFGMLFAVMLLPILPLRYGLLVLLGAGVIWFGLTIWRAVHGFSGSDREGGIRSKD